MKTFGNPKTLKHDLVLVGVPDFPFALRAFIKGEFFFFDNFGITFFFRPSELTENKRLIMTTVGARDEVTAFVRSFVFPEDVAVPRRGCGTLDDFPVPESTRPLRCELDRIGFTAE